MRILIQKADPSAPESRKLIERLDNYLKDLYPSESNHLLSVEDLRQPNVTFLIAEVESEVAGCGAYIATDGKYAEIKRMFVLPEFRGLKIGRLILEELEKIARTSGLEIARLETGVYQPEALRLYQRANYQLCRPFGDYSEDLLSVFMEKKL